LFILSLTGAVVKLSSDAIVLPSPLGGARHRQAEALHRRQARASLHHHLARVLQVLLRRCSEATRSPSVPALPLMPSGRSGNPLRFERACRLLFYYYSHHHFYFSISVVIIIFCCV
jgi:hypothetical protein